jgi:hypothetical protein
MRNVCMLSDSLLQLWTGTKHSGSGERHPWPESMDGLSGTSARSSQSLVEASRRIGRHYARHVVYEAGNPYFTT